MEYDIETIGPEDQMYDIRTLKNEFNPDDPMAPYDDTPYVPKDPEKPYHSDLADVEKEFEENQKKFDERWEITGHRSIEHNISDTKKFDPEGSDYDKESALKHGLKADETGHWPSRVPETGLLLKGAGHETWHLTVEGEAAAGYEIEKGKDGRYYSHPKQK